MKASGVLEKTALVFGQWVKCQEPAYVSAYRTHYGRILREEENKDTLLFIDNIFRYVQAGLEVRATRPYAISCWISTYSCLEMGMLQERITTTQSWINHLHSGSLRPADDYTDPAPATTFQHLDASTVLSRKFLKPVYSPLLIH
jgi:F-type H+-transporting ATPase subunit beta